VSVKRQDCHKNRYGEYICRTCQASGIKFTRLHRSLYWNKPLVVWFLWLAVGTLLSLLIFWWLGLLMPMSELFKWFQPNAL
jgi:hypothetical protein